MEEVLTVRCDGKESGEWRGECLCSNMDMCASSAPTGRPTADACVLCGGGSPALGLREWNK
jgi:hypothetical protein